jgi:hypothetical protein
VRERRAEEVEVASVVQVVGRDVGVVRADEPLDVCRVGAVDPLVNVCDRGVQERRLPLIWARRRRRPPSSLEYELEAEAFERRFVAAPLRTHLDDELEEDRVSE